MKPIHKLSPYDDSRFSKPRINDPTDPTDPVELAVTLIPLLTSQDPEDRRTADRLAKRLASSVYCPNDIWVCQSEYLPDANGKRWSDRVVTWSAHLTREEARRWHKAWKAHWAKRHNNYGMLPVHVEDNVPIYYLRHPDADPVKYMRRFT